MVDHYNIIILKLVIKLLIKKDDISIYLNEETLLDGFSKIEDILDIKELDNYIKSYIEPTGMYDFNNFLRYFSKTVIIDYLSVHISLQMSYYLYNSNLGMHNDLELFCMVYNQVMSYRYKDKFKTVLKHLGKSTSYIYQFRTYEEIELYIRVFEYKYVSDYLLRYIEAPSNVYKELRNNYDFETSRLEIHRYLNRVYNYTRKI